MTSLLITLTHSGLFVLAAMLVSGMIANASVDIWRAEGVFPVPKYKDDLKAF